MDMFYSSHWLFVLCSTHKHIQLVCVCVCVLCTQHSLYTIITAVHVYSSVARTFGKDFNSMVWGS